MTGVLSDRMRVVVLGYVVRGPFGGMAWHHLHYVLGLHRLGHQVFFIEDSDDYPSCYDPSRGRTDADPRYGLQFAQDAFARIGLPDAWAYHDAHTRTWRGPGADRALGACRTADVLLNVSGVNPLRAWSLDVPTRILIDTDPVFTQIRHLQDPEARRRAAAHTAFFTFGENVAAERAACPPDGFPWRATRQPVVLDTWRLTPGPEDGPFTTIMQWDSYPPLEHGGVRYGMKSASFPEYAELPGRVGRVLELAATGPRVPRDDLRAKGWGVVDPAALSRTPWTYQEYIRRSKAEFSLAKHGYVMGRSGWFSERSANYLAGGRPVAAQDTGFTTWLPSGSGVVAFGTLDEAAGAVQAIASDYRRHCRAAQEIAAEFFDARTVLPRLLELALAADAAPLAARER
jgi:hypothetical protein